jgi:FkbM family methyltransferase
MQATLRAVVKLSRHKLGMTLRRFRKLMLDIARPPLFKYRNETLNDRWIAEHVFPGKKNGYFVEAGAAGGIDASCTYVLEKAFGWTGICVEPNAEFFSQLRANRPNSLCENVCLAKENGKVLYIEGGTHTVDPYLGGIKSNLETFKADGHQVILCGKAIEQDSLTLEAVLDKHHAPRVIDYAAFDIEGSELEVLSSFPFDKYTFLALSLECDWSMWNDISRLLVANGYKEVSNPFNVDMPWERYWLHNSIARNGTLNQCK